MYLINPPIVTGDGMARAQLLEARLTEVLAENERLKSQSVRREMVQVQVPQYIDRPELVQQVDTLKGQVAALEKNRLQLASKAVPTVQLQAVTAAPAITEVVERTVTKMPSWVVPVMLGGGAILLLLGVILGRYAG